MPNAKHEPATEPTYCLLAWMYLTGTSYSYANGRSDPNLVPIPRDIAHYLLLIIVMSRPMG